MKNYGKYTMYQKYMYNILYMRRQCVQALSLSIQYYYMGLRTRLAMNQTACHKLFGYVCLKGCTEFLFNTDLRT